MVKKCTADEICGSKDHPPGNIPRPVKVVYLFIYGVIIRLCTAHRVQWVSELICVMSLTGVLFLFFVRCGFDVAQKL